MEDTHVLDSLKVNSYIKSMGHTIFIDESIAESTYYRNVINILNSSSKEDKITMIIDSNGGYGSTAMTLTHAMDRCEAHITGVLSGSCKSAATIIALHCDTWEVGVGLDWLAHTASFGIGGEANKVAKQHEHEQKIIRELLFREYAGFYSEEEIEDIASGNDSLLNAEQVSERLTMYQQYRVNRETEYHQAMDQAMWDEMDNAVQETLEALPFSEEDKATFNKVLDAVNSEMEKQSGHVVEEPSPEKQDPCVLFDVDEEPYAAIGMIGDDFVLKDVYGKWEVTIDADLDRTSVSDISIALGLQVISKDSTKTLISKLKKHLKNILLEME